MYARIENNIIVERDIGDHGGESGWHKVPDADVGKVLTYDTDTSSVRARTDAENAAERDRAVLADAWRTLRHVRDSFLKETDEYTVSDRPATTNMPQYRAYLRGLPATYNDTSILSQTAVMDFDAYVASL